MKKWVAAAAVFILLCVTINVGVLNRENNYLKNLINHDYTEMMNRTTILAGVSVDLDRRTDLLVGVTTNLNERTTYLYEKTDENMVPNMIERVLPSVVKIGVNFPSPDDPNETLSGHGSGVVIDSQRGLILTCAHVAIRLFEPNAIGFVQFNNSDVLGYVVNVAVDQNDVDLAVVMVDWCPVVDKVVYADYTKIMAGQSVIVIGSPYIFKTTVTAGIISGIGFGPYEFPTIHIDADLNPGNSGGPAFNINGEIVGLSMSVFGGKFGAGLNGIVSVEAIQNALPAMLEAINSEN